MPMTPRLRRLALTTHVTTSVGWAGAVVAYLALAIAGLTSADPQRMRAAYLSMELVGWFVIIPFSVGALATGLVGSLGTEWGLFRHHWLQTKFFLTIVATVVLFVHMRTVSRMSNLAAHMSPLAGGDVGAMRIQLVVHAAGGLLVLLVATALSVYKPWGRTAYGERMQRQPPRTPKAPVAHARTKRSPAGVAAVVAAFAVLLVLAMLHLHGSTPRPH